jgi:elongation factor P
MLATDLKTGTIYKEDNAPQLVLKYEHIKVARGGANVKVKTRNLITDHVLERSYLATEKVESADTITKNTQYLYEDKGYVFMDPETYEQVELNKSAVYKEQAKFLKEGEPVQLLFFEGKPVSLELPRTMIFEVEYTEPGFKGNTVSNVQKDAKLDNGATVKVPTFIKIGDRVKINTSTGEYVSKA